MESWISIPSSKHNNQVLIHIFQIIFRRGKPDYWEIRTEACGFLWYFLSPSETLGCRYSSLSWCSSISHVGHASANDGWKHLVCWNVLWSASLWLSLLQMCSLNNWASLEDGGWLSWLLMLFAHHTFSHLSIFHWKEPWYGGDGSNEGCSVGTDFKQLREYTSQLQWTSRLYRQEFLLSSLWHGTHICFLSDTMENSSRMFYGRIGSLKKSHFISGSTRDWTLGFTLSRILPVRYTASPKDTAFNIMVVITEECEEINIKDGSGMWRTMPSNSCQGLSEANLTPVAPTSEWQHKLLRCLETERWQHWVCRFELTCSSSLPALYFHTGAFALNTVSSPCPKHMPLFP